MIDKQTFKEPLGAVFFACLADCDAATARKAADILEGSIETGTVQDERTFFVRQGNLPADEDRTWR